ncbi:MAG: cytochrome c3 family protein [Alcanivoracaceae bacterium]
MYVLIRRLGAGSGPNRAYKDEELAVDELTIGRGTDQGLLLQGDRIAYQHADISLSAGQCRIRSRAATGITVNGRSTRVAVLNKGDQILIGDYRLIVLPTPDGFDLALSLELLEQQDAPAVDPSVFNTRLDGVTWSRPRLWAWGLFLLLLMVALVLPAMVLLKPDTESLLRGTPLPDDSLWLSGPLHSVHSTIGKDCQACHTTPFQRVTNDTCIACHESTALHIPVDHPDLPMFDGERCASCHHEHNGEARMVFEDQRFCASCHNDLGRRMTTSPQVERATDFLADHPPFRLSLLEWQADTRSWLQGHRREVSASLRENSHLKFDHALHLDAEGIKNDDGVWEVLACGNCHQPALDGINMAPVSMEQHCAHCHGLAFDPLDPKRVVPHGRPEQVLANLREYYSGRFIQNRAEEGDIRALRPGQGDNLSRLQREGLAWVENRSLAVAEDMFERRACVTCHEVERTNQQPAEWWVKPVRLNSRWFVSSEFPHQRHTKMECADCHAATDSSEASDVLMPDIAVCQDCHVGQQASSGLRSGCISCHSYHQFDGHGAGVQP